MSSKFQWQFQQTPARLTARFKISCRHAGAVASEVQTVAQGQAGFRQRRAVHILQPFAESKHLSAGVGVPANLVAKWENVPDFAACRDRAGP